VNIERQSFVDPWRVGCWELYLLVNSLSMFGFDPRETVEGEWYVTLKEEQRTASSSSKNRKRVKPCSSDSATALKFESKLPAPASELMPAEKNAGLVQSPFADLNCNDQGCCKDAKLLWEIF
jgi:hypothetical protein